MLYLILITLDALKCILSSGMLFCFAKVNLEKVCRYLKSEHFDVGKFVIFFFFCNRNFPTKNLYAFKKLTNFARYLNGGGGSVFTQAKFNREGKQT